MRRRRGGALIAAASLMALALGGCSRRSPSMLHTGGSEARHIEGIWWLMFGLAAAVYAIVAAFIVIAIVRGRPTESGKASRIRDDSFIWIGGIGVPVIILGLLAGVTVTTTNSLRIPHRNEVKVEVVGKRWWWAVQYPGTNVTTANEIHVPVGRPIDIAVTSDNVIHSFWVPQLAGKLDMIPGQTNHLRFTIDKAGTYRGLCAEYCGLQHARMDFIVIADPSAEFDRWMARRTGSAGLTAESDQAAKGQLVFERESCAGCHTIKGTSATGTVGPDLSDFGGRHWIGAITVPNTRGYLAGWISDSQSIKPGNLMPPISLAPDDLNALVDYLEGLK